MKRRFNPWMGRPLEKEMATHSSTLAWRVPWTEQPGGLQFMESQRFRHDWACMHTRAGTHTHTHTHKLGRNRNCIMTWVIWSHTLVVIWFEFANNIANSLACSWNLTEFNSSKKESWKQTRSFKHTIPYLTQLICSTKIILIFTSFLLDNSIHKLLCEFCA